MIPSRSELAIFGLASSHGLAESICRVLGVPLGAVEERAFEDGEHKSRPIETVREKDVFAVCSLHGDRDTSPNDKLCRLLFFAGAVRDAGAARVTAVVPYLCYARKDRRTKSRDPVTSRYVATLFEAVGIDRVLAIDVHNAAAYENAFRIPAENLEAKDLFVEALGGLARESELIVVSPDAGGVKRAERFREALSRANGRNVPLAFLEKYRSEGAVSGGAVVGDVAGKTAIVIDDLVATGTTLGRAARACRERGAVAVHAVATHGLFVGDAARAIADPALASVVVTDTVPPFRLDAGFVKRRITILSVAPMLARAIARYHHGSLLDD